MRRGVYFVGVSLMGVSLFFGSCFSKPAPKDPDFRCKQGGELAPEWTCIPTIEKGIAAPGVAKPNAGDDIDLQMQEAMSNGRTALAKRIEIKVETMIKNWKRATGSGGDQTFEKNLETVSRQVSKQTLRGSKQLKYWKQQDGTLWILVGIDSTEQIFDSMKKAAKTSFKNDQALWQQFQSEKAMKELDEELKK